ncbi:MAG: glycosyltransferase family 39 protein [Bacteroidales bacterium]|nr:glycosyltransferase family 39 protein [Bacteroidales bacterium]MDG2080187.1 glycosyltransferase family 39 protein [Bacteroidales bacterium]
MNNFKKYSLNVIYLIVISTIVRSFLAYFLELGNDEVYYRLYGLFPDWSHFDHPIMIGLVMQITTLDMAFQSEFFLRLGSIIIGAFNIWIVFKIGLALKDERTGFYASLIYVSSVYATIITGVFILPDTPQSLFWLWALLLTIKTVPKCPNISMSGINMLKLSVVIGLGILSKYTTIFLWIGIILYIFFYNRDWLKSKWLYIGLLISAIISIPILIWNIQNDFISINFHTNRVDMSGYSMDFDYLISEILGEFLYNNPIVYILVIVSIIAGLRGKLSLEKSHLRILLLAGLPIVITFIIFSLFRRTLPHWTAPGITSLIPLAAVYISDRRIKTRGIPVVIILSLALISLIITLGLVQINSGFIPFDKSTDYNRIGKNDPSLDIYGYRQAGDKFVYIVEQDRRNGVMDDNSFMVGSKWFPLANYEYYFARKVGMNALALGKLTDIHKYAWINEERGGFIEGADAYYITDSREFNLPDSIIYRNFESVTPSDTIDVIRGNEIAKRIFIFRCKNLITKDSSSHIRK